MSIVIHSLAVPWEAIEEDCLRESLKTLARFRKAHPTLGRIDTVDLDWCFEWEERFVPLDLSLTADERAALRETNIGKVRLVASKDGNVTRGASFINLPVPVFIHIADEEYERGADIDWEGVEMRADPAEEGDPLEAMIGDIAEAFQAPLRALAKHVREEIRLIEKD